MVYRLNELPIADLRLLVFDLDGTLIDSSRDLSNSVNAMLVQFDRKPLPETVIASYIGDGAGMLVRRALGDPADESYVDSALNCFLDYYREHKLDYTRVYPGVIEALEVLRSGPDGRERAMAVLTNKPIGPSEAICDALGLTPYFFKIYGGNSFATKKPDPAGLDALIREAGVTPRETLMIGDSGVDILTARNAGAWALGCRFGLSPHTLEDVPADCLVDSALEWIEAMRVLTSS
ncbi:MAG TPA: HAD-IA family hydrolase [Acidisarcina sp.]